MNNEREITRSNCSLFVNGQQATYPIALSFVDSSVQLGFVDRSC